jgi:erythromycin esterase-like protein
LNKEYLHNLRESTDLSPLFEQIRSDDVDYVLLGEASHGTSDFYKWRTEITKHLVSSGDFSFIAIEGDWPDSYNVNRYVKGLPESGKSAYDVLSAFNRWPTWMWANKEVVILVEWLRQHNLTLPEEKRVGFYGLDVYSLWESMEAILNYLQKVDPGAVRLAIEAYGCFEPYGKSVEDYARATAFIPESCKDEVIKLLVTLRSKAYRYSQNGLQKSEEYFNAEQNALVLKNAELYYRKMMYGGTETWNIRDSHMMETLKRLMNFYGKKNSKSIVWAHNTHIGDARHTDMTEAKMFNLGQLVREDATEKKTMLVGFGTNSGTVIASREWGEPMQIMSIPNAIEGSWDKLLHDLNDGNDTVLVFKGSNRINSKKYESISEGSRRGQRAIGVVYHPEYEAYGNYVSSNLEKRYDVFLYIDKTQALHPLHMPETKDPDLPETYPSGL